MTDSNKKSLIWFAKVSAIALPAFIAIITFAGVLNGVVAHGLDAFYGWVSGINLGVEGYLFYLLYRKLFPKQEEVKK